MKKSLKNLDFNAEIYENVEFVIKTLGGIFIVFVVVIIYFGKSNEFFVIIVDLFYTEFLYNLIRRKIIDVEFGNLDHSFGLKKGESDLYSSFVQVVGEREGMFVPEVVSKTVIAGDNNGMFLVGDGSRCSMAIRFFFE